MARLANQIVSVCAWLTNFQGVLVPTAGSQLDDDVDDYLVHAFESDSEYDADESDTCDSDWFLSNTLYTMYAIIIIV